MNTDAFVLHKSWSGESSAHVVFFTEQDGIVHCFYKGGRAPQKQTLLQPFTPVWLEMDVRREARFVRHLEITSPAFLLTERTLFSGMYLNELLYHALKPHDSNASLFEAYQMTLHALTKAVDKASLEASLRRFEWALLKACGYPMSLTHEADTGLPIHQACYYHFRPGDGFVLSYKGIMGAYLLEMSADRLDCPEILKVAKWIMRRAISHALDGKEIKARGYFSRMKVNHE